MTEDKEDAIAMLCKQITENIDTMNTQETRPAYGDNLIHQFDPLVSGGNKLQGVYLSILLVCTIDCFYNKQECVLRMFL